MYELIFWRYKEDIYLNNQEVYEDLLDNKLVDGLEELPISVIKNRIANVFKNWEQLDSDSFKNTSGVGAFHLHTTIQSIQINCYGTHGKDMNKLCEILEEFKCPLYDPQVPTRYDEFSE